MNDPSTTWRYYLQTRLYALRKHSADAGHCQEFRNQCTIAATELAKELGEDLEPR